MAVELSLVCRAQLNTTTAATMNDIGREKSTYPVHILKTIDADAALAQLMHTLIHSDYLTHAHLDTDINHRRRQQETAREWQDNESHTRASEKQVEKHASHAVHCDPYALSLCLHMLPACAHACTQSETR